MPRPRQALNAFTAEEVHRITGISLHMLNYLLRAGYLAPAYGHGPRGKVRYYSYRDLAVVVVVQRLRASGVELGSLKKGIRALAHSKAWLPAETSATALRFLVTDGRRVLLRTKDQFLDELNGQRSFAFVVDLESVESEVLRLAPEPQVHNFTMQKKKLRFAPLPSGKHHGR